MGWIHRQPKPEPKHQCELPRISPADNPGDMFQCDYLDCSKIYEIRGYDGSKKIWYQLTTREVRKYRRGKYQFGRSLNVGPPDIHYLGGNTATQVVVPSSLPKIPPPRTEPPLPPPPIRRPY